ncbi:MAG: hypothetical protein N3H31_07205, partial [Candidatus Nezhaarchaeota archaeon]|nr:hypothetical protein [Candidatus Nezhaarchaeota archaeon]
MSNSQKIVLTIALVAIAMLLASATQVEAEAKNEIKFLKDVNLALKDTRIKFDLTIALTPRPVPPGSSQFNLTVYRDTVKIGTVLFNVTPKSHLVLFPFNATPFAESKAVTPGSTAVKGRYNITLYYNKTTSTGWRWEKNATAYFYVATEVAIKLDAKTWIYYGPTVNLTRPGTPMNFTLKIDVPISAGDVVKANLSLLRMREGVSSPAFDLVGSRVTDKWVEYKPRYGKYKLEVWNATHRLSAPADPFVFYAYPEVTVCQRTIHEWMMPDLKVPDAKAMLLNFTGKAFLGEAETDALGVVKVAFKSDLWIKEKTDKVEFRVLWSKATGYSVNVFNWTGVFDDLIATNTTACGVNVRRAEFELTSYEDRPFGSTPKVEVRVAVYDAKMRPISDVGIVNSTGQTVVRIGLNYTDGTASHEINGRVRAFWRYADIGVDYIINAPTVCIGWDPPEHLEEDIYLRRCHVTDRPNSLIIYTKPIVAPQPVSGAEVYVTFPGAAKTLLMITDGSGIANFTTILGTRFIPMVYNTTPRYGWISVEVKKYGVSVFKGVFSPKAIEDGNYTGKIYVDLYWVCL